MNMFARFNENPAMTLQDIKETKRYRRTDGRTDVKTVYPLQTKFAGGIIIFPSLEGGSGVLPQILKTKKAGEAISGHFVGAILP